MVTLSVPVLPRVLFCVSAFVLLLNNIVKQLDKLKIEFRQFQKIECLHLTHSMTMTAIIACTYHVRFASCLDSVQVWPACCRKAKLVLYHKG